MKVIERTVAYEDRNPESPRRYASHPSLTRLTDGRLLLVHRVGSTKSGPDGNLHFAESTDDGRTWTPLGLAFDSSLNGRPRELRSGMVCKIEPGRLLLVVGVVDRSDPEAPLINVQTEGALPMSLWLSESTNNGASWAPLRELDVSPMIQPFPESPPILLPDGRLAIIFETYKTYTDSGPWVHKQGMIFSSDGGRTWGKPNLIPIEIEGEPVHWDHRMVVLPDDTVLDLFWIDSRETRFDNWIYSLTSADFGHTWTKPTATGIRGQRAVPLVLADGRVLMIYVYRDTPPSIRGRLSEDGGKTWEAAEESVLYAHTVEDRQASESTTNFAEYLRSMKSWSFGCPSAVQLPGGDVVFVHYAGDKELSNIYCVRMQV